MDDSSDLHEEVAELKKTVAELQTTAQSGKATTSEECSSYVTEVSVRIAAVGGCAAGYFAVGGVAYGAKLLGGLRLPM